MATTAPKRRATTARTTKPRPPRPTRTRPAGRRRLSAAQHRRREETLTHAQPSKVRQTTNAVVCKCESLFLTCDESGDVPLDGDHGLGLYFHDCRYLDGYTLAIEMLPPTALSSSSARGYETLHHLSNPDVRAERGRRSIPKDDLAIERHRVILDDVLYEVITLHNYGREVIRCALELSFRSRFLDLFVIRGFVKDHGKVLEPRVHDDDTVVLRYDGIDRRHRTTTLTFSPKPKRLNGERAEFELRLRSGEERKLAVTITPREHDAGARQADEHPAEPHFQPGDLAKVLESDQHEWLASFASVRSANPLFDAVIRRSLLDLRILRSEREDLHFVAAGVPWFATLFGRDSCIVGLQTLPFGPRLAAETLKLLASLQATGVDTYREAEPGKILHELRTGELADARKIPQSPAYYGTVDATLLWIILLGQYLNWSGDLELARSLRGNLDAALDWSIRWADHDGDGYLDYAGQYEHGLINQGWKDSGNSIVNADGSLARPPIALCEVQSYAYRAWRTGARILRALGDDGRCSDLLDRAAAMRRRFEESYWSERLGCYVLALQKDGRPCEVVSSNTGQVLWGGVASRERAARVARRLLEPDMFSGWGIRTLSSEAAAFNPLSYHLGSVWPHDNSLIVGGLRRYGCDDAAERVFGALFDAAANLRDYRVPELYCGYGRNPAEQAPVGYPVACSPQAWAAAAVPYALWQMLGLRARALEGKLIVRRARLPKWLPWLEIHGLGVGGKTVDLRFQRRDDGGVDVHTLGGDAGLALERVPDPSGGGPT